MKKIFSSIMLIMLLFAANAVQAQETTERKLTREEKKAMQEKLDSLLFPRLNCPKTATVIS